MLMFAVSPFCFRVSALVFVPLAHFRTPEYEFRTLSGCAVKMYQIWRFVLPFVRLSASFLLVLCYYDRIEKNNLIEP